MLIEVAARLESKKKEKKAAELLMSDLFSFSVRSKCHLLNLLLPRRQNGDCARNCKRVRVCTSESRSGMLPSHLSGIVVTTR